MLLPRPVIHHVHLEETQALLQLQPAHQGCSPGQALGISAESRQFALDSCFLRVVLSAARLSPVPVFSRYLFNGSSGPQSPARQVHSQSRQPQRSEWQSRDPQAERDNGISGKPQGTTIKGWVEEDWAEDSKDSWSSRAEGRKFWNKRQRYLRTRGMNAFAGVK